MLQNKRLISSIKKVANLLYPKVVKIIPTDTNALTKGWAAYVENGVIAAIISNEPNTPPSIIRIGWADLFKKMAVIHSKRLSISKFNIQIISR